jgi:hypothetical protein
VFVIARTLHAMTRRTRLWLAAIAVGLVCIGMGILLLGDSDHRGAQAGVLVPFGVVLLVAISALLFVIWRRRS